MIAYVPDAPLGTVLAVQFFHAARGAFRGCGNGHHIRLTLVVTLLGRRERYVPALAGAVLTPLS